MKNNTPDSLTIQQYLEGKLDKKSAHELERQALEDPFLWEALEGYSVYRDPASDLSILQRQLHERIVHLQENKKVFDLSWQRLSIAAAAAVMFISAGILFWMNGNTAEEKLASEIHKPVDVQVIDRDSVAAVLNSDDPNETAYIPRSQSPVIQSGDRIPAKKTKAVYPPKAEENFSKPELVAAEALATEAQTAPSLARQGKVASMQSVSASQPKIGWKEYQQYIKASAEKFKSDLNAEGSVVLSFKIGSTGMLSDIKVLKGIGQPYDQEAIRILKEGPAWLSSDNGQTATQEITITFGQ